MFKPDKDSTSMLRTLSLLVLLSSSIGCARSEDRPAIEVSDSRVLDGRCEVACGQCLFDLEGEGCTLAIRWQGDAMFVAGSGIDDHGDAHAAEGLCNMIRSGDVKGEVKDGRFIAQRLRLVGLQD